MAEKKKKVPKGKQETTKKATDAKPKTPTANKKYRRTQGR